MSVDSTRTRVVLPAPFGPSTPSTVPWRTSRSTPSRALVAPKCLTRPRTSTAAVPPFSVSRRVVMATTMAAPADSPPTCRRQVPDLRMSVLCRCSVGAGSALCRRGHPDQQVAVVGADLPGRDLAPVQAGRAVHGERRGLGAGAVPRGRHRPGGDGLVLAALAADRDQAAGQRAVHTAEPQVDGGAPA